jgi:hypothetical protein
MHEDSFEREKLDNVQREMELHDEEAVRNRLVIVKMSSRRQVVIKLAWTAPVGGHHIFVGQIVFGPAPKVACEEYVRGHAGKPSTGDG